MRVVLFAPTGGRLHDPDDPDDQRVATHQYFHLRWAAGGVADLPP
jgi:hypothetical protein